MITTRRNRPMWTLAAVAMAVLVLTMTSAVQADVILRVDFNSNQDGGGNSNTADDPSQSAAAHNQEGWSSYHANHEAPDEFATADYDGITITPAWPNTSDNRTQQSIDRGAGNDGNWDDSAGDLNLVTDWIGIDTRTGNGGNGDWDGATGTPTYMTLTLGGLNAGVYGWTSFHHDTENVHGTFAVWVSTDGGATFEQVEDGIMTDSTDGGSPASDATEIGPDAYTLSSTYQMTIAATGADVVLRFAPYSNTGVHRQIWGMNGFELEQLVTDSAGLPNPKNGATDVLRDTILTWVPGTSAVTHDVFLGMSFEDVNNATVPTAAGLDVNSFDPGRLDFNQTYYWRVDEMSSTGERFKGAVWNFTAEPYSIMIPGADIAVVASSESNDFSTAAKVIDGSGLDPNTGAHATAAETMWFTASVDLDPWIQFEFEDVKKLDMMTVWNSNGTAEAAIGWGVKDVEIAYSVDGETWGVADANQFSRAPGTPTYDTPDEIALGGVAAKMVRLNIQSNWGGILMSYGLSEVQFFAVPTEARSPEPASGSVDIAPNSVVAWRAGLEAAQHTIYVSTDQNAVADGVAPSVTTNTNSLDLGSLDLGLGQTYYWRVDEVNEAEAVSVWPGAVWNFSTPASLVVDDFETYNNISPDRPFQTWLDGFGYSADEYFPQGYGGNGTGAGIGHDIWSLTSPHYNGNIMETTIAYGGSQSMPLYYSNTGGVASETQRNFDTSQDWTVGGVQSLSLMIYGAAGNTGQLYMKINNTKITGAPGISLVGWQAWIIDLSTVGGLQNVTSLAIGVDGAGASGMVYIDQMRLYPEAGELIEPTQPGADGLVAHLSFDENSGATAADGSGNGNHGDVVGDAVWVAGKVGGALAFDGVDDMVVVNQNSGLPIYNNGTDNAYSVALWVKGVPQNDMRIFSEGSTTTNTPLLNLGTHNSGTPTGQFATYIRPETGTTSNHPLSQAEPFDDTWHHIVWVDNNGTATVYIDGLADGGDFSYTRGTMALDTTSIGGILRANPSHWFTGQIDEVHIYNRALSAGEAMGLAGLTQSTYKPFE